MPNLRTILLTENKSVDNSEKNLFDGQKKSHPLGVGLFLD